LIRQARKTSYEIAEGFREADLKDVVCVSAETGEQIQASAVALAEASGVSVEVAELTIIEAALREHCDSLKTMRSN